MAEADQPGTVSRWGWMSRKAELVTDMRMIDNTSVLLGDDLKQNLGKGSRLKIAAACFSIYAFEALRKELEQVDGHCQVV